MMSFRFQLTLLMFGVGNHSSPLEMILLVELALLLLRLGFTMLRTSPINGVSFSNPIPTEYFGGKWCGVIGLGGGINLSCG